MLSPEEAAAEMRKVIYGEGQDPENGHMDADAILCGILEQLGYREAVEIFRSAEKWYS